MADLPVRIRRGSSALSSFESEKKEIIKNLFFPGPPAIPIVLSSHSVILSRGVSRGQVRSPGAGGMLQVGWKAIGARERQPPFSGT